MRRISVFMLLLLSFLLVSCNNTKTIKIQFESNGGPKVEIQEVKKGDLLEEPLITRDGYVFEGWYESLDEGVTLSEEWIFESSKVTKEMTLYAQWKKIEDSAIETVEVTFDAKDGSPTPNMQEVEKGEKVMRPEDLFLEGYEFLGWYLNDVLYNFDLSVEFDIVLVAKWKKIEEPLVEAVEVTFDAKEGFPIPSTQELEKGEKVLRPEDPFLEGYEFIGWFLEDIEWDFLVDKVNEDLTLVAKWEVKEGFSLFSSGLLAANKDNKWGYINNKNEVVIEFIYDWAEPFIDGYAIVEYEGKRLVIDPTGNNVLDQGYSRLEFVYETELLRYYLDFKYGLININEELLLEPIYDKIGLFQEDVTLVELNNKYGFINKLGEVVIPLEYDETHDFNNGLALVKKDGLYGYIDYDNNLVINFLYESAFSFDEYDRAVVYDNGNNMYKLINSNNEVIIESSFIRGSGILYGIKDESGNVRFYDYNNNLFSSEEFKNVYSREGYFVRVKDLEDNEIYVWFAEDGTILAKGDYYKSDYMLLEYNDNGELVPEDYFITGDEAGFKIITKTKSYEFTGYEFYQFIEDEKFIVIKDGKFGIIDKDKNVLLDFLYDEIAKMTDGYYFYIIDNKCGIMNSRLEIIIPPLYDNFY